MANRKSPLGINLNPVSYWTSEQPFLNIFKTGGGWITQTPASFDTLEENNIPLDSDGYPTRIDGTGKDGQPVQYTMLGMLLERQASAPNYPAGRYVVLYEGEGTLAYKFNATLVSSSPGRDVINVAAPSKSGIWIQLKATDPNNNGNYIRNIRVVHETQEAAFNNGQIFNPALLNRLSPFHSLRFMDWMKINGSQQSTWGERPHESKAVYGDSAGVPLEVMAELSNRLQADPWFNMPHMATDDYITQFATLARTLLTKNQRVYVEYSNETWNSSFVQSKWIQAQGQALWPTANVAAFAFNRSYYGMRTAQMCDIWKNAWGAEAGRVVCVLASQAANTYTATSALACGLWVGKPCNANHGINTLAIAPYFGYVVPNTITLDQLFGEILQGGVVSGGYPGGMIKKTADWINNNAKMAKQNSLDLVGYEGGQALVSSTDAVLTDLYITANADSRMGLAYEAYLQGWKAAGAQLFEHFNDAADPSRFGMWGALTNIMNVSSPKYDALIAYNTSNPCWWNSCEEYVPPDTAAPSIPSNLTKGAVSPGEANMSWAASTDNVGVVGYNVYRDGAFLATMADTAFLDTQFPGKGSYTVSAFDAAGNASAQSGILQLDGVIPSVPSGLAKGVVSPSQASLSWAASTDNVGVTGYNVYRDGVVIATTASTTYVDSQFPGDASYKVEAFDDAGNVSAQSASLALDGVAPSVPASLAKVSVSPSQASLSWAASTDNVGVTGYNVYRDGTAIATITSTTFLDTQFPGDGSYRVEAFDDAGNVSAQSASLALDGIVPSAPSNFVGSASPTQASLTWAAATDNVGVASYNVYREGVFIASTAGTAYLDGQFVGSGNYSVAAVDAAGNVSVLSTSLFLDGVVPSTPANLTGNADSASQASLSWAAANDNVGVAGYNIYRDGVVIATTVGISFVDTQFPGSGNYNVVAFDAAGNVSALTTSISLDGVAPSVPANLTKGAVSATQANFSWAASTDNVGVTGYRIYRNGSVLGTTVNTTFQDLQFPGSASYGVAAFDAAGNASIQSISLNLDGIVPSSPSNLKGTATSTQASLSWSAATDNVAVTGYNVYRDGVVIAIVTGTSYVDTQFPGSGTFNLAAIDAAGNVSARTTNLVLDKLAPSVPTNLAGSVVSFTQAKLSWSAATDAIGVSGYRVYRNGVSIGTSTATAFTDSKFPGSTVGSANYTVVAYDAAGNISAQAPSVSVVLPTPTVVIKSPTNGATFTGTAISILVTASDTTGIPTSISIIGDGKTTPLKTCLNVASCTYTWPKGLTAGQHTISATATNKVGNTGSSPTISITYR